MPGKDNDSLIVTVLQPQQVKCHVQLQEISKIIKDYLQLLEMYAPLIALLKQKNVSLPPNPFNLCQTYTHALHSYFLRLTKLMIGHLV